MLSKCPWNFMLFVLCIFLQLINQPTYALNKIHWWTSIKLLHVSAPGYHHQRDYDGTPVPKHVGALYLFTNIFYYVHKLVDVLIVNPWIYSPAVGNVELICVRYQMSVLYPINVFIVSGSSKYEQLLRVRPWKEGWKTLMSIIPNQYCKGSLKIGWTKWNQKLFK
jgi:hypothetical protein